MFDNFSPRARQVVFVARFKTGERGATAIEVDDFIDALILEDQGMLFSTWEVLRDAFIRGTLASTNINSLPTK